MLPPAPTEPAKPPSILDTLPRQFETQAQAAEAFKLLLRETVGAIFDSFLEAWPLLTLAISRHGLPHASQGVTASWTWEQTMRAVISHPLYNALKTLAERKQAFAEYQEDRLRQERVRGQAKRGQPPACSTAKAYATRPGPLAEVWGLCRRRRAPRPGD